jgi:hypothetical protein
MGMIIADRLTAYHSQPIARQGSPIVDQGKVDAAANAARHAVDAGQPANLAKILSNPDLDLNQAERNALLQTLARDERYRAVFFGDDNFAANTPREIDDNQRIIAAAVKTAYADGALTKDDLLAIADSNGAGNGAQRFMHVLSHDAQAMQPGGIMEDVADALWARNGNDGVDRAVASIYYSSSATLMASNLDTPDKRAAAFESLVQFNEKAPYKNWPGEEGKSFERAALAASAQIFTANSDELIDRYTALTNGETHQDWLAKFVSQTVLNPNAQDIPLDHRRYVAQGVSDALTRGAERFIERAKTSGETDRAIALEQLGRLTAAATMSGAIALNNYSEQLKDTKEGNEKFADMMGAMLGDLFSAGGNTAATDISTIIGAIIDGTGDSHRPDIAAAKEIRRTFTDMVSDFRDSQGNAAPHALGDFNSAYSRALDDMEADMNINLGGYPS